MILTFLRDLQNGEHIWIKYFKLLVQKNYCAISIQNNCSYSHAKIRHFIWFQPPYLKFTYHQDWNTCNLSQKPVKKIFEVFLELELRKYSKGLLIYHASLFRIFSCFTTSSIISLDLFQTTASYVSYWYTKWPGTGRQHFQTKAVLIVWKEKFQKLVF